MKKIKKDIDNIFDKIIDEDIKLPQSALNIIAELPPKKTKKELRKMETKTQSCQNKWMRFATAAISCVLVFGIGIGGYFLFRSSDPNNSTAEQAFSNAINKMSQEPYVNIDDAENQSTYVFEKGKMVSVYSEDDDTVQWLNKDGSLKKEDGLYYKNSSADKSKLSQNMKNLLLDGKNADSYCFGDTDNEIIVKLQDTDYTVTLENGMIKSVVEKDKTDGMNFGFQKNDDYYAPGAVVSVLLYNYDSNVYNGWLTPLMNQLSNFLDENLAIETVDTLSAGYSQATQIQQITDAIERGVDLMIVQTYSFNNADVINMANSASIPIIFFGSGTTDESLNFYNNACFVGEDWYTKGKLQGQMIAEYLLNEDNIDPITGNSKFADIDGTIYYALVRGQVGHMDSIIRSVFAVSEARKLMADAGKDWTLKCSPLISNVSDSEQEIEQLKLWSAWDFYYDLYGTTFSEEDTEVLSRYIFANNQWDPQKAYENFKSIFNPGNIGDKSKLGIIISNNDGMITGFPNYDGTPGVITALNEMGYNLGGSDFIPVFGVDGDDNAISLIDNGQMTGTVYCDFKVYANAIYAIAVNSLVGKPFLSGTDYEFISGSNKLFITSKIYTDK